MNSHRLTPAKIKEYSLELVKSAPEFEGVISRYGFPPVWERKPGFATLVHIILEQQVSLASAKAAFDKLEKFSGAIEPLSFLTFGDAELKTLGFSRQKTAYCRHLAQMVLRDELDLPALERLADHAAREKLIQVKGIGRWSSDVYLLMVLLRPDVWPKGDIALATGYKELFGLAASPSQDALEEIAEKWRPYRSVAARLLWQFYLGNRGKLSA